MTQRFIPIFGHLEGEGGGGNTKGDTVLAVGTGQFLQVNQGLKQKTGDSHAYTSQSVRPALHHVTVPVHLSP